MVILNIVYNMNKTQKIQFNSIIKILKTVIIMEDYNNYIF